MLGRPRPFKETLFSRGSPRSKGLGRPSKSIVRVGKSIVAGLPPRKRIRAEREALSVLGQPLGTSIVPFGRSIGTVLTNRATPSVLRQPLGTSIVPLSNFATAPGKSIVPIPRFGKALGTSIVPPSSRFERLGKSIVLRSACARAPGESIAVPDRLAGLLSTRLGRRSARPDANDRLAETLSR